MKTPLVLLTFVLFCGCATGAEKDPLADKSPAELKSGIEAQHPAAYYILASKLFGVPATKEEAVFWFYVGQIRYRYHLAANPKLPEGGDPALFASLSEVIGRPINEYAGGNPDRWISIINRALEWDAAHDNAFTPKSKSPKDYRDIRAGLAAMRDQVGSTKDKIHEARRQNGLER